MFRGFAGSKFKRKPEIFQPLALKVFQNLLFSPEMIPDLIFSVIIQEGNFFSSCK